MNPVLFAGSLESRGGSVDMMECRKSEVPRKGEKRKRTV